MILKAIEGEYFLSVDDWVFVFPLLEIIISRSVLANFWKLSLFVCNSWEIIGSISYCYKYLSVLKKVLVVIPVDIKRIKAGIQRRGKNRGKVMQKSNEIPCDLLGRK